MRAISAAQQGVLDAGNQAEFVRVSVKDAGGTFRDLTSYPGFNAVRNVTWGESIDNPHQTFNIDLIREMYGFSLSPFVAGSPVNTGFVPGGTVSPLIALNRELKVEVAIVPMGMQPAGGDWFEVLRGRIDTMDAASSTNVNIAGRGLSGRLAQQYIKRELVYSFAAVSGAAVALLIWAPNMTVVAGDYVLPASRGGGATPDPGAPGGVPMFLQCSTGGITGTTEPVWTTGAGQADGTAAWDYVGSTTTAGNPVEQIMQNIMDRNRGAGDPSVTMYVPSSPGWGISEFQQQRTFVLDAVRALAQQIGWDLRYKWRAGTSQFEFTFSQPDRSSPSVDHTFAPSEFYAPTQLAVDISVIRNLWELTYSDSADLWPDGTPKRKTVTSSDSASITKYGELYAEVQEDSASQIDTSAEAQALVDAAKSDCKEPNAVMGIALVRGFPWAELNDYYTFSAGGVVPHFDSDQSLAVTQYSHTIQGGDKAQLKTTFSVRGLPTIGTAAWLGSTVHPRLPPRSQTPFTSHRKQSFTGVNTPKQSLSSAVGGAQGYIGQSFDKNHKPQDFEVHIYPVSGTALSSSTLYAVTSSLSNSYVAGLTPGKSYFMKTVPRTHDGRMDRGEASAEQSFVAGQALAGHLSADPDLTRLPLNGGFETQFDTNAPPDHWALSSGTWGTDINLVTGSGGISGENYLSLTDVAVARSLDSDLFVVEAGAPYEVTAWLKEHSASLNAKLVLTWYDASKTLISANTMVSTAAAVSTWTQYSFLKVAPSTARWARISVATLSGGTASGFDADLVVLRRLHLTGVMTFGAGALPNANGTTYLQAGSGSAVSASPVPFLPPCMAPQPSVWLGGWQVAARVGSTNVSYSVESTSFPFVATLGAGATDAHDVVNFAQWKQTGTSTPLDVKVVTTVAGGGPVGATDVTLTVGVWN